MDLRIAVTVAVVAAGAVSLPSALQPQTPDAGSLFEPGERIRLEARGHGRLVGTLVERSGGGLVISRDGGSLFVADSAISSREVSLGYHSEVGPYARTGAIGGAAVGLVFGIWYAREEFLGFGERDEIGAEAVFLSTVIGSAAGAAGGALLGLLRSGEDWVPVDREGHVFVDFTAADRSPGLGVRLTLQH